MRKFTRETTDGRSLGANCDACPIQKQNPVLPERALGRPSLVILGAGPGMDEDFVGRPMTGRLGEEVRDGLRRCGVKESEAHFTNAIMCRPPHNLSESDWGKAVTACAPRLQAELDGLKGKPHIHAISKWASYSVGIRADVKRTFGYPAKGKGAFSDYDVTTNFWPVGSFKAVFLTALSRAVQQIRGEFVQWSWGEIHTDVSPASLAALQKILAKGGEVAIDIETIGISNTSDKMSCIGFSNGEVSVSIPWHNYDAGQYGHVTGVNEPVDDLAQEIRAAVVTIIESQRTLGVFHNGAYDTVGLRAHGIEVANFHADTLLAHAVVAQQLPHDLGFACSMAFPNFRWKEAFKISVKNAKKEVKGDLQWVKRDPVELRTYNARDAYMTYLLWQWEKDQLDHYPRGWDLFRGYMDLAPIAARIQERGVQVDIPVVTAHRARLGGEIEKLTAKIVRVASLVGMPAYNPNSTLQTKKLFIDVLGEHPKSFTDSGKASFGEEAMIKYKSESSDERVKLLATLILEQRANAKLKSSYADKITGDHNGIHHESFNLHGTLSGRFSAEFLQVMPKPVYKAVDGKQVLVRPGMRDIFRARPGMYLVEADYSQLELRLATYLSGAALLTQWFDEGRKVHNENAKRLFGENYTENEKTRAKNYIFGKLYGAEDKGLAALLNVSLATVQKLTEDLVKLHPELFLEAAKSRAFAEEHRYIATEISGRRRYYFDEVNPTEIFNFRIQGTGADITNAALKRISARLDWPNEGVIAQVHDAIILEGPNPERLRAILKEEMERPVMLKGTLRTLPTECKIGTNWGAMGD